MANSDGKWQRMLSTLSGEEVKAFDAFLHSPYHQRSSKLLDLWALLAPWFPEGPHNQQGRGEALDRRSLFSGLFPGTGYKDSNLSNLLSSLVRSLEEFWVQEALQQMPAMRQRLLLRAFRQRKGLEPEVEKLWSQLETSHQATPSHSPEDQFLHLLSQEDYLSYQSEHQPRTASMVLGNSLDLLNKLTLQLHLKYWLAALNRFQLVGEQPGLDLQETLWQFLLDHPDVAASRPIRVYVELIRCLTEQTSPDPALAFFAEDLPLLGEADAKMLLYLLLNLLNKQLKTQGELVLPALLGLYRLGLEQGLLFAGDYLDAHVFLNIVNVATGAVKQASGREQEELTVWRAAFVETYQERLPPGRREETVLYAEAYLAYQSGDYAAAYRLLNRCKPADALSDLSRRSLLIRVYYDAWDDDLFDAQVKSALMYISRAAAVSEGKRLAYNRFVRLTRQLFALRGKPDRSKALEAIRQEVQDPEALECRLWLQEKLAELDQPAQ